MDNKTQMELVQVKEVEFLEDTLLAAQDEKGNVWVAVNWVSKGIGLSDGQMKSERKRIQDDLVLSKGGRNFNLPTNGGNQDVLCIALEFLPLWLAKISITPAMKEDNPETVEKLVEYQLKAKDVLAAAFLKKQPQTTAEIILEQAQFMVEMERKQKENEQAIEQVNKRVDGIREIVAINRINWRDTTSKLINEIALKRGGYDLIHAVRGQSYAELNKRLRVNVGTRQTYKRQRMAEAGATKSERDKLSIVDIIADDPKLIEGYIAVVKDMAIAEGIDCVSWEGREE